MESPSQKTSSLLLPATLTEGLSPHVLIFAYLCVHLLFPGYRHSERMIEKLRSAGLGFYVRETETQQKLGSEDYAGITPTFIIDVSVV